MYKYEAYWSTLLQSVAIATNRTVITIHNQALTFFIIEICVRMISSTVKDVLVGNEELMCVWVHYQFIWYSFGVMIWHQSTQWSIFEINSKINFWISAWLDVWVATRNIWKHITKIVSEIHTWNNIRTRCEICKYIHQGLCHTSKCLIQP